MEGTIQLEPLVSEEELTAALEQCRAKRLKLGDLIDVEAEPCHRVPGLMPHNANHSGHCHVVFDITEDGKTENIRIKGCSEDMFENPSYEAVAEWRYLPEVKGGVPVMRGNVTSRMVFRLLDADGNVIPEPTVLGFEADHTHKVGIDLTPV